MLETLTIGAALFASTNIDDVFLLMAFFSDPRLDRRAVVAGQYAGIGALVAASVLAAACAVAVAGHWIALLGLAPLAIGLHRLWSSWRGGEAAKADEDAPRPAGSGFLPQVCSVAGVTDVLARLDRDDAAATWRTIMAAKPGGLGRASRYDLDGPPPEDLRAAMREAAAHDAIARLWTEAHAPLFAGPVADLVDTLAAGAPLEEAVLHAFLSQLARTPDPLIARRLGGDVAAGVSSRAAAVLATPKPARPAAIAAFDHALRVPRRVNPGTTADLIAASVYTVSNRGQQAGLAQWYGVCQYFYRGLTDRLSAGARLEWFRDNNGFRTAYPARYAALGVPPVASGFAGNFWETTLGLNWMPTPNWVVRPEIRYDWYTPDDYGSGALPFGPIVTTPTGLVTGDAFDQWYLGCDAIFQF